MCWKHRELSRFADGTYKPVPVALDYPAEHYVHLSVTESEPDSVAYTPSPEYGERDRQVRLKFGRYLKKTFTGMSDADIQAHVTSLKSKLSVVDSPAVLKFATDTDTLNLIFETRMTACGSTFDSCMYGKFEGSIRPYHVYANSPDVAVAYVVHNGDIISRSVVSTKDMTWVRCYSVASGDNDTDCGTLKALLKDAGYSKGDLIGNRLTKLSTWRVMLPYIDNGGAHVRDDGKYWTVVEDGEGDYEADCTDGSATPSNRCERCGNHQGDCTCLYCDCCEESYPDGCDSCRTCDRCDRCIEHDRCQCERCSDCHELMRSCECDRCGDCNELADDCECEDEDEDEDEDQGEDEDEVIPEPIVIPDSDPGTMSYSDIRTKLKNVYVYLRKRDLGEFGFTFGTADSPAMAIIRTALNQVTI